MGMGFPIFKIGESLIQGMGVLDSGNAIGSGRGFQDDRFFILSLGR